MNHISEQAHNCDSSGSTELEPVDILVIGGGVNGLAIAREAIVRGWSTAVVDADDFAAGTSATSSRLIHGGIRYLENLEFALVRESLRERERLLQTAGHLVRPFPLLIPFYRHNRRRGIILRLGMLLYDILSFDKTTPPHRVLNKKQAEQEYPGLETAGLYGATVYYDAQVADAERLCIEQAIDVVALGGHANNHQRVVGIETAPGGLHVHLIDTVNDRRLARTASVVVNAAGPWVDIVLGLAEEHPKRLIGGTKGSHITVGPFRGAPTTGVHFEAISDGRAILVLPLPDGNYLIGATDIFFEGDPAAAVTSDAEIDYLLTEACRLIPAANLTKDDVIHSVSGVRPLPYTPTAKSAAQVSRDHHLIAHPSIANLFSVSGGKLTTHRALGEMVMTRLEKARSIPSNVSRKFGPSPRRAGTRGLKLPGARTARIEQFATDFLARTAFGEAVARRLVRLYGVRADSVETLALENAEFAATLPGHADVLVAEVILAIREEFAQTVVDVLARRLLLVWRDDAGLEALDTVARISAKELGWTAERQQQEIDNYRQWIQLRRPRFAVSQPQDSAA